MPPRRIRITPEWKQNPDLTKLAHALLGLTRQLQEQEAKGLDGTPPEEEQS